MAEETFADLGRVEAISKLYEGTPYKPFQSSRFETAGKFWNLALKSYLGTEDEAVCQSIMEKAMVIGYTRMMRRAIRRPEEAESPAKIARCKEMLLKLLNTVDELTF